MPTMLQCFVARTKKAFNVGLYIVVGCCIGLMLLNVFQTNVQINSNPLKSSRNSHVRPWANRVDQKSYVCSVDVGCQKYLAVLSVSLLALQPLINFKFFLHNCNIRRMCAWLRVNLLLVFHVPIFIYSRVPWCSAVWKVTISYQFCLTKFVRFVFADIDTRRSVVGIRQLHVYCQERTRLRYGDGNHQRGLLVYCIFFGHHVDKRISKRNAL